MSVSKIRSEHYLAARIRGLRGMASVEDKPDNLYQYMGMAEDLIEAYEAGLLKWTDGSTAISVGIIEAKSEMRPASGMKSLFTRFCALLRHSMVRIDTRA